MMYIRKKFSLENYFWYIKKPQLTEAFILKRI